MRCSDNKRGQLTLFVFIGVLLVAGVVLFFSLRDSGNGYVGDINEAVVDSVYDCVLSTSESSYRFVSYQGGYFERPEKNFNFDPLFFSYYYYEGQNLMPSNDQIASQYSAFVDEYLPECLDSTFSGIYELSYSSPRTVVEIDSDGLTYTVDLDVTFSRDEESFVVSLARNPVFIESKLYGILDISRYFVEDQVEDPSSYCLSCVSEMAEEYKVYFYLFPLIDNVVLAVSYDEDADLNQRPVVFNFVNKYAVEVGV